MEYASLPDNQRFRTISLDSEDASQQYVEGVTSLNWPLFEIAGKKPFENIQGFKVLSAVIPTSWYNFHAKNNTFILTEQGQTPVTVTLPIGSPNIGVAVTNLATALSEVSPTFATYTVVFDLNSQKLIVSNNMNTVTEPFSLTFGTSKDTGNTNPRKLLGFGPGVTTSSTWDDTLGDSLYASFVANVTGPCYLYLNSRRIGSFVDLYLPTGAKNLDNGNAGPQIAQIPVTINPNGWFEYVDPAPEYFFNLENMATFSHVDFYLTLGNTNTYEPLDLNGLSFVLKLGIIENLTSSSGNPRDQPQVRKRIRAL